MRVVFCGTPEFAVPTLERLHTAGHHIALAVTRPDRPKGRGMEVASSAVKRKAIDLGLEITQPERIKNNEEFRRQLQEIAPDVIVIVAYGRIIPRWMLDVPRYGNLNLHASLLPKYRGAAPIQWAIANGESVTGNTVMRIDEGLDTGDILLQREITIDSSDTSVSLAARLAAVGGGLVVETLEKLERNEITPREQNDAEATLAPLLTKEDGKIDFERAAQDIHDRYRGFQPWPGAYTSFRDKKLTIHACHLIDEPGTDAEPGTLIIEHNGELSVHCGNATLLVLDELQFEGKKRLSAREFLNGYQVKSGELLGR